MKRGTDALPKFLELCELLELPKYAAVGLLQTLWTITAESTPRGDIGQFSNNQIAKRLEWDGDHDALISALVASRWLDANDDCRLYVHDWHVHAEDFIHRKLTRSLQLFADGSQPNLSRVEKSEKARFEAEIRRSKSGAPAEHRRSTVEASSCAPAIALDLSHCLSQELLPMAPETAPGPSLEKSSKKSPSKRSKPTYPPEFETLWKLFPHKENKLSALPVWRELSPGPELLEQMRGALEAQIAAGKWNKPPGEPMLQFVNWLKKRRWEDYVAPRAIVSVQIPSSSYGCQKCLFGSINVGAYKLESGLWKACDCSYAVTPEQIQRQNAEILRRKQSA